MKTILSILLIVPLLAFVNPNRTEKRAQVGQVDGKDVYVTHLPVTAYTIVGTASLGGATGNNVHENIESLIDEGDVLFAGQYDAIITRDGINAQFISYTINPIHECKVLPTHSMDIYLFAEPNAAYTVVSTINTRDWDSDDLRLNTFINKAIEEAAYASGSVDAIMSDGRTVSYIKYTSK